MTPEAQRIAIAEACGWKFKQLEDSVFPVCAISPEGKRSQGMAYSWAVAVWDVPDYLNDLNAMHEAEKVLNTDQAMRFRLLLSANSGKRNAPYLTVEAAMCHATAAERSEAFLRILGLWQESQPTEPKSPNDSE